MQSFQAIRGYVSSAKDVITTAAQSIWKSDTSQAVWQGLSAPYYTYKSWRGMFDSSEDLRASITRSIELNSYYLSQAFIAYFIYYRVLHAGLGDWSKQQDENSWSGSLAQAGIMTTDAVFFGAMNLYLIKLWLHSAVQNWALTSSTTITASKVMRPSIDFKPCHCDRAQAASADGKSLLLYVGNRYVINKFSYAVAGSMPGWKGGLLAFCLESASFGIPLVEYKFSAAGRCGEHRYADIFSSHKIFTFAFGASFVALTWGPYKVLSVISGADNPYIYDAFFSFMYQMYILMAISRDKKFPGNDKVTIDIAAWFNYLIKTRPAQYFLEKFSGNLHSLEKLVQSPGVGLLLTVRGTEIKDSLTTVKDGIQQVKDIQNNRLYTTAKWMSYWLPYTIVPDELKMVSKTFSKKALSKMIQKTELLLEIAKSAEEKRATQRNIEDKVILVSEPESKSIITTGVAVTSPRIIVVQEEKLEEKAKVVSNSVTVKDDYFDKEPAKLEFKPIPLKRTPGMFSEKDVLQRLPPPPIKRTESLATATASIISRTAMKVSR